MECSGNKTKSQRITAESNRIERQRSKAQSIKNEVKWSRDRMEVGKHTYGAICWEIAG